jgi:hypothetical protein
MLAVDPEKYNTCVYFILDEAKWGQFQVLIFF